MAGGKTSNKPSLPPRADFEEIEAAVMETARGRWFLAEYARRHRAADTSEVLEALARIEAKLTASLESADTRPVAAAPVPAPEAMHHEPAPPPPIARADDLKAMAEELLRGSRLFDWTGTGDPEPPEEMRAEPSVPEPKPEPAPPPLTAAKAADEAEPELGGEEPEEELDIDDLAEWEAELAERTPFPPMHDTTLPPPRSMPPAPAAPPAAHLPPSFTQDPRPPIARNLPLPQVPPPAPRMAATALPELPEVGPRPVERPKPSERSADARLAFTAPSSRSETRPVPPGSRMDDPTLTMTRDEKLALFS